MKLSELLDGVELLEKTGDWEIPVSYTHLSNHSHQVAEKNDDNHSNIVHDLFTLLLYFLLF